jgi:anti-sigma-K factor RskA
MTQPTDLHTLAGAYALDALTDIERAGFARHMAECAACATEVAELTETAARMGAATALTPPPGLRAAVLAEISRTRQVRDTRPARTARSDAVARWRGRSLIAAAAAIVALAGLGTVWTVEEHRLSTARDQTAAVQAEQNRIDAILTARDVTMHSSRTPTGGQVTVAVSPSQNDGVVLMANMPAPPAGKTYQLWLIHNGTPTSAGVMAAGARAGTAVLPPLDGADSLGVTVEPAPGGSATPTLPVVVGVPLT